MKAVLITIGLVNVLATVFAVLIDFYLPKDGDDLEDGEWQ